MVKFLFVCILALFAVCWIAGSISHVSNSLPLPLKASYPVTVDEFKRQLPEPPAPEPLAPEPPAPAALTSDTILQENKTAGPDGKPNHFFHTPETARRAGVKKYTSGPCRNYYQGEEWWCK